MRIQAGVLALGVACALAAAGAWARERRRLIGARESAARIAAPALRQHTSQTPAPAPLPSSAPVAPGPAAPVSVESVFARLVRGECGPQDAADALRSLPPDAAVSTLRAAWPSLTDPGLRVAVLEALWREPPHPAIIDLLDLGMRDPDANVEAFAADALWSFAFREFVGRPAEYEAWRAEVQGLSLEEAARAGAARLMREARGEEPRRSELGEVGWRLQRAPDVATRAVREAGLLTWLEEMLTTGDESEKVFALRRFDAARPGEAWGRERILPMLADPQMASHALQFLGHPRNAWAWNDVAALTRSADRELAARAREALGRMRDPRTIPLFVDALRPQAGEPPHIRAVIAASLHYQAGIPFRPGHDDAWWLRWWEEHGRAEFGGEAK